MERKVRITFTEDGLKLASTIFNVCITKDTEIHPDHGDLIHLPINESEDHGFFTERNWSGFHFFTSIHSSHGPYEDFGECVRAAARLMVAPVLPMMDRDEFDTWCKLVETKDIATIEDVMEEGPLFAPKPEPQVTDLIDGSDNPDDEGKAGDQGD